jgi:hypothetical protein
MMKAVLLSGLALTFLTGAVLAQSPPPPGAPAQVGSKGAASAAARWSGDHG